MSDRTAASPASSGAALRAAGRAAIAVATAILLMSSAQAAMAAAAVPAEAPPAPPTWSVNLYDPSVVRLQNPDRTACVAAATVSMLGIISLSPLGDTPPVGSSIPIVSFRWAASNGYATQERVQEFERRHMTMSSHFKGGDPHGWRNALNYFGWGSINAGVYRDVGYPSFATATKAAVNALARIGKPVGVVGWSGAHAQYITGYVVTGEDPRISSNYSIVGVYMSDPLRRIEMPNNFIPLAEWKSGPEEIAFSRYEQFGSDRVDPVDGQIGDIEWYHKWVLVEPVE